MTLDILKAAEIIETMENWMASVRPRPEIRHKIDLGYEINGESIFLHEIRPAWDDPDLFRTHDYAKATFVESKNIWKIYWMRGNLKWASYEPNPTVKTLAEFLKIVSRDEYDCFYG